MACDRCGLLLGDSNPRSRPTLCRQIRAGPAAGAFVNFSRTRIAYSRVVGVTKTGTDNRQRRNRQVMKIVKPGSIPLHRLADAPLR